MKTKNKNKTFSYPEINDENLQTKIFRKNFTIIVFLQEIN